MTEPILRSFAEALLEPTWPVPEGVAVGRSALRFDVHRNNVVHSLVEALADTFPACRWWVGEEFFRAMASVFVRECPPTSRLLVHYGALLPTFVESFDPAGVAPGLADLARLEHARVMAYHAADRAALTEQERIATLAHYRVDTLHVELHPSLCWSSASGPAAALWAAYVSETTPHPDDLAEPRDWLAFRDDLDVPVIDVSPGVPIFLSRLADGEELGEAAVAATEADGRFDVSDVLTLLARYHLIVAIRPAAESTH